jgi:hypothetical protein
MKLLHSVMLIWAEAVILTHNPTTLPWSVCHEALIERKPVYGPEAGALPTLA